jgi:Resolvase, N terminal domain
LQLGDRLCTPGGSSSWPPEQIVVIDCDQGQSGSSAVERAGFQELVTEVSMNRAGIVMGLEVSRLARNSSDWHRLLQICALTHTFLVEPPLHQPTISAIGSIICTAGFPSAAVASNCFTARWASIWYGFFM